MACIHYKFKNSLDFDSITFDGLHISVRDLKDAIMQRKKLNDTDMDLLIINALNAKAYKDEDEMIPKNASVIVARIPLSDAPKSKGPKTLNAYKEDPKPQPQVQMPNPTINKENLAEVADLVTAKGSEEDKIKAMMKQSTKDFDPANYARKYPTGTPSPSYVCFKCNKTGHFIHNCPNAVANTEAGGSPKTTEADTSRMKRPTGIPHTFLTTAKQSEPGAMSLGDGRFAVPVIDQEAFKKGKKERPPFLPTPAEDKKEALQIPTELTCLLCKDLLTDAVVIPCCGNSYCDECIRNHLLEDEDHKCPTCHEENVSPDKLIINKSLRVSVNNFKNETLYQKPEKRLSPPPPPPPKTTTSSKVIGSPLRIDTSVKTIDLTIEPSTPVMDEKKTPEDVPKGIAVLSGRQPITTEPAKTSTTVTSSYRPVDSQSAITVESYTPSVPIPSLGAPGYRPSGPPVSLPNTALPPPGYRPPLLYPPSLVPPPLPYIVPPGFIPPQVTKPLSEHEFYREKKRLLGKPNPLDDYTRPLVDKEPRIRSRSPSPRKHRSKSRSRSRSPKDGSRKKSFSRTPPPKKRSFTKSRSRSPFRKKKSFSRSRSRSLRPRSRSRLRSRSLTPRSRSRSWTPKKFRGRSRSFTRSRTRSRSRTPRARRRTYSRSPLIRRRSYSKSPSRRRSYSRSPRRRSRSPFYRGRARSPGYFGYGRELSPYRGYRSPPGRGYSPGRYGPGGPPYGFGGRNEDYPARFDQRIYEEIFQDYIARFGLPPPPPPSGQQDRMYFDPHKGVYRERSKSRSPRSRHDRNKDRKDDKSRNKDKKTTDKSSSKSKKEDKTKKKDQEKSKVKKDNEKSKSKKEVEKSTGKEEKEKENKVQKNEEKDEGKSEKAKDEKTQEKKIVKKVIKKKPKEEGTGVKKESIALRLKTKAGALNSPVKAVKAKSVNKESESNSPTLQAINRTGALKTIATTDHVTTLPPKESVHSKRKNSNLIEINTQELLPEVKDIEKSEVTRNIEDELKVESMETDQNDGKQEKQLPLEEKKDEVNIKNEDINVDKKDGEELTKSPKKVKVKVIKKVKKMIKLVDGDASQSDSASDLDKVRIRKKKRVQEINKNEENSQDESPAKRMRQDSVNENVLDQNDNSAKDEDQLMLSPPELSKWERDDYNEDKSPDLREKLKKKAEKKPLPRSVIESAEKAITQKQPKPAVIASAVVPARPPKKLSVHDRLQKSPVRQNDDSHQKSPSKNDVGNRSPIRQQRRVYMDEKQKQKEEDENRRVHNRESSMQITISSDKNEKDGDNSRYKNDRVQKRVSDNDKSNKYKESEKSDRRRISVDEKPEKISKSRASERDSSKEKDHRQKEKVKRDHSSEKDAIDKTKETPQSIEKIKNSKEDVNENTGNYEDKKIENGQKEEDSKPETNDTEKEIVKKKKYERKESIVDESAFVPDYNEHSDSESEGDASSPSHEDDEEGKGEKEKDEKKHKKHKKEKKHKKNKKHKHKHKKKKHKKNKEEKESTEKTE